MEHEHETPELDQEFDPVFEEEQQHLTETYAKLQTMGRDLLAKMEANSKDAAADKLAMVDELSVNLASYADAMETYADFATVNRVIDAYNLAQTVDAEKLTSIQVLLKQPYFAKVVLQMKPGQEPKELYIGTAGIADENYRRLVVDWRSPVAEVYYNQENGPTSYEANGRTIRVDYAMRIAENDIMHWREEVDGDRITIGVAPAAMYACHPSMFSKVSEFARRENVPVAMHVAGNREEYNFIKYGSSPFSVHTMDQKRGFVEIPPWLPTGTTPVRYALNWGAFESDNVLAIHCVHVDDKDVQKLKEYDVAVAVCPRCNAQLGMGVAPINEFMRAGLRLGMGTDSPAATDSTDMLTEMRIGMLVQRAVNVGEFLDSATMLEMATIGGARALKLDDKIGSLEIGKLADIIAVDLSGSHQTPTTDPVSAVVNTCSGADILMTMVNGTALYEKNKWNVGVEVARNIARIIEIRGKLRL